MRGLAGTQGSNGGARPDGFRRVTPRQAQILQLAASGLSDKEIARRLQVSHRTVRTHFEKLFHDHGIRNRSQAIALWSGRRTHPRARPADECPYPKPFPPDFAECPAYQATQMVSLDISHRPLGAILTCRHLESRLLPRTDYRWYGACVIGDAEARRRWSDAVGSTRLHDISALRQEVSALSAPFVQRIFELRTGADRAAGPTPAAVTRQMESVADQFMTEIRGLLRKRQDVLNELHMPLEACLRLVRIAIDRFVDQGLSETEWEVPDEVLALFPSDVQAYFRPRTLADSPGPPPASRASDSGTDEFIA